MTDDEVQPQVSNQQPIKYSNQNLPLPYANNANTNDNIDDDISVPKSMIKTEPEEYTSPTDPPPLTYPALGSQPRNYTYVMDISTIQQFMLGQNATEEEFKDYMQESKETPQIPINSPFLPANNTAFSAMGPPAFPIQSQPTLPTFPSQIQPQLQPKLQPETAAAYLPPPGQPAQNYQATISASPSLPGQPNYQATASGLPGQPSYQATSSMPGQPNYQVPISSQPGQLSYQVAASSLLGQYSYQVVTPGQPGTVSYQYAVPTPPGQPNYQAAAAGLSGQPNNEAAFSGLPAQFNYHSAAPGLPEQPKNEAAFPGLPGQPSFQARIHSNYVSYNQPKSAKYSRGNKTDNGPIKPRGKRYKIENESVYYSAESCSENDDKYEEYIEEEVEIRNQAIIAGTKFSENVTGDARTDLIRNLLNELVILIAQGNNSLPEHKNAHMVETFEATEEPSNVKFTVQHETKFKKDQDVKETSERWFVTSKLRSNVGMMKDTDNMNEWQPGAEKITFDHEITDAKIEQYVEGVDSAFSNPIEEDDSKSSSCMQEQKPEYHNSQEEDCACPESSNDAEMLCRRLEQILEKQKSDTKAANGKCNCCHCRAVNSECTTPIKSDAKKESRDRKFLELCCPPSESPLNNPSASKPVFQMPCTPVAPYSSPRSVTKSGPLQDSFPVTIVRVTAIGASSLYVKWTIHDCANIGGYEIYVDNFLTNRYFNGNHSAAVICNIDVNRCQKIVLVAHTKIEEIGEGPGKTVYNSTLDLPYTGDQRKWTPSVYLYNPTNLY